MTDIRKLIETINKLTETDIAEDKLQDTMEEQPEVKSTIVDTMSTADQLAAKTKIARSLDILKDAIEEFKDAAVEKIDLLHDEALMGAIEGLDLTVASIESILNPKENLEDSPLNDIFKDELPDEPAAQEAPAEETKAEPEQAEEAPAEEDEEEDLDFDAEATLDLLNGANEV